MNAKALEKYRARRADRRQRRAWRKERRKPFANGYDATNQAESNLYRGGFFTKR